MIEQDTVKLLRECDAGVKMGIDSIDDVYEKVEADIFKAYLEKGFKNILSKDNSVIYNEHANHNAKDN